MKRKLCSMILMVVLVFSLGVSASAAADNEISPQYDAAASCTPALSFSEKTAICSMVIRAKESAATITATMTLYKIESNGILTWVADWKNLTGTGNLTTSKTKTVTSTGCNYRLSIKGTVKDSTGTHSISAYRDTYCSKT